MKYLITIAFLAMLPAAFINAQHQSPAVPPKIVAYVGILHPLVTYARESKPHFNFDDSYVIGMPVGINIWKNPNVGFFDGICAPDQVIRWPKQDEQFSVSSRGAVCIGKWLHTCDESGFRDIGSIWFYPGTK